MSIEPFEVSVDEQVLQDLEDRIRNTRWADDFDNADGNFIGMMKCSKNCKEEFFKSINQLAKVNSQAYYTIAIENMIKNGEKINFDITDGLSWTDIDTNEDLLIAKEMFSEISVE